MEKCEYCNNEFKNKISKGVHQKLWCNEYKEYLKSDEYLNLLKYKCEFCNKSYEHENQLSGHKSKCKIKIELYEKILTPAFLNKKLIIEKITMSELCRQIKQKYNLHVNVGYIVSISKKYGIKTPNIKTSKNYKKTQDLYKKTCIKKYGKPNALSKGTDPYIKRNNTVKEKYGCDNVFQNDKIIEKIKLSCLKKYGVTSFIQSIEYEKYRNNGKRSKLQKVVEKELTKLNIDFDYEVSGKFTKLNDYTNKIYSPIVDILIEHKKIVIEVYGDKWHANPKIYKQNDLIQTWDGLKHAKDIQEKDKSRKEQIESFGYIVLELWEQDIRKNIDYIITILKDIKK